MQVLSPVRGCPDRLWAGRSSVQHPVHATFHNSSVANGNSSDVNPVHSITNADLLDADTTPSVADDNSVDANANPSVALSKIPMVCNRTLQFRW